MPVTYKIDILAALKSAGYTTYKIRKEKLFGEATLQKIRKVEPISWENIATLCRLIGCQPGDIIEYVPDEKAGHPLGNRPKEGE
jgi:putative transcriptional regulator